MKKEVESTLMVRAFGNDTRFAGYRSIVERRRVLRLRPQALRPRVHAEKSIMYAILADLRDRRGLRQEFEACDQDIQEEIMAKWLEIIQAGGEK